MERLVGQTLESADTISVLDDELTGVADVLAVRERSVVRGVTSAPNGF